MTLKASQKLKLRVCITDSEHGLGGPLNVEKSRHSTHLLDAFLEAGQYLGYSVFNTGDGHGQSGFSPYLFTIKDGYRWTTADAYLKPAVKSRSNLFVALNTQVRKVTFGITEQGQKFATGIQASQDSGHSVFQVRDFIQFLLWQDRRVSRHNCQGSYQNPFVLVMEPNLSSYLRWRQKKELGPHFL